MLVPLDLLVDVECLQLGQDLNHCLLHASLHHQRPVVWSRESLLSNLYPVNWTHSVTDLVVAL